MFECVEQMLVQLVGLLPTLLAVYVLFDCTALLLFRSN